MINNISIAFLIFLASLNIGSNKKEIIEKAPVYKKGTFWKIKHEQINTRLSTQQKSSYITNHSCYIDKITEYNGVEAYEVTYLKYNKDGVIGYIQKSNLNFLGIIGVGHKHNDTIISSHELLSFPLFYGKKWSGTCKLQNTHKKSSQKIYDVDFQIISVSDTTFFVESDKVKTKAFKIKADFMIKSVIYKSEYIYLASSDNFPGSCPLFLYTQFDKNSIRVMDNKGIDYDYISVYIQTITNFHW